METQQGFTVWLTGMSGAGKSALAAYLAKRLPLLGRKVELLDMSELGGIVPEAPDTSKEVRDRNVRLLGWTAKLLTRNGVIPVVASVSPNRELRDEQRRQIGRFFEVFVDCPFDVLLSRDEEGIYRRALAGELQGVVGVQTPYEPPPAAEAAVDMGRGDVKAVAVEVFERMTNHGYLSRQERDLLINGSGPAGVVQAGSTKGGKSKARPKAKQAPTAKGAAEPKEAAAPKAGAAKAGAAKAGAAKAGAAKAGAAKAGAAKAGAAKAGAAKTGAAKAGAAKAGAAKASAAKAGADAKAGAAKAGAAKAGAAKAGAAKAGAAKAGAAKAGAAKAGAAKAGAAKAGAAKAGAAKAGAAKAGRR